MEGRHNLNAIETKCLQTVCGVKMDEMGSEEVRSVVQDRESMGYTVDFFIWVEHVSGKQLLRSAEGTKVAWWSQKDMRCEIIVAEKCEGELYG